MPQHTPEERKKKKPTITQEGKFIVRETRDGRDVKTERVKGSLEHEERKRRAGVSTPGGRVAKALPGFQQEQDQRGIAEIQARQQQPELISQVAEAEAGLAPTTLQEQFAEGGGFQEQEGVGERFVERGAELGLAIPAGAANLISSGLKSTTGIDIGKIKAADLAETGLGKTLGISIGVAAAAGLWVAAGAAITAGVAATIAKIAVSGGAKAVAGAVAVGGLGALGFSKDAIVDVVLKREKSNELQSSVNTVGEMSTTISGTYKAGGISKVQALAELNQLENMLTIIESKLQQAAILDPEVKRSGQLVDIQADIIDQRSVLREARADILAADPQYNPAQIMALLEVMQLIEKGKRDELVKKGAIGTTI